MKINYFTFNSGNSKSISIKQFMLGLVMMLSVSFDSSLKSRSKVMVVFGEIAGV